jgi:hypothetical protein
LCVTAHTTHLRLIDLGEGCGGTGKQPAMPRVILPGRLAALALPSQVPAQDMPQGLKRR